MVWRRLQLDTDATRPSRSTPPSHCTKGKDTVTATDFPVLDDSVIQEFATALSHPDAVLTDRATLATHGHDFWGFGGTPGLILRPRTLDEVVAVVRVAGQHHIPLVTRGGASNCAGAMMPHLGRVLSALTMDQDLGIDSSTRTARFSRAHQHRPSAAVRPHGLCFSPDPVSAHLATVGGNIIENAGGPHALKYGVTYNHVIDVEVVLADGTVIHLSADDDGPRLAGRPHRFRRARWESSPRPPWRCARSRR